MMNSKMQANLGMTGARRAPEIPRKEIQSKANAMQPLSVVLPNPEVPEKAERRRFSAEYKLKILRQADECRGRRGDALKILSCQSCIDVIIETHAKISPTGRARRVTSSHDQGDRTPKYILER